MNTYEIKILDGDKLIWSQYVHSGNVWSVSHELVSFLFIHLLGEGTKEIRITSEPIKAKESA